ncbi:MAG: protein kinase [Planctomycetota bacterium]|nr:protein kinase [Planctomycetota bacterium]
MDNDFDKIRRSGCTIYVSKDLRNNTFEQLLTAGEKELQEHYRLPTIPSSESARVYKFTINSDATNREVYLKQYRCRSVLDFIKHLFRDSRARRAFKGTLMLAENGFDVPAIAAMSEHRFGFLHTGDFLATLEVKAAKKIHEFIPESSGILTKEQLQSKRTLIRVLGRTVGKMHAKAIFHGDLRSGNILARQEKTCWRFFFIDNERTKKFCKLPARLQLKNLVQLNLTSPNLLTNTDRMRFLKEYWAENGNGKSKRQKNTLIKKIIRKTSQRLSQKSRGGSKLRKCLRTNARYLRIKTGKYLAVFDRSFCQGPEALDFTEQIDALMDKGQILKNGDTTYVSQLRWHDKEIVVKRYNHRGFVYSLRHTIKGSRARRCWLNGHRLMALNIPTPKPIAFIEQRKGMLLGKSYLVTEYSEGQNLHRFLQDDTVAETQKSMMVQQVTKLLDRLQKYRISHGDMKHTNILVTDKGPVLTDLDAMKGHRWNLAYRRRQSRDTVRFLEKFENR